MGRKGRAAKMAEPWHMDVKPTTTAEWHRAWQEWWESAKLAWAAAGAVTQEMGIVSKPIGKLERRFKLPGSVYFMVNDQGRVCQANLYVPGDTWSNMDKLRQRLETSPMLAAGSIQHEIKKAGGYLSEETSSSEPR